MPQLPQFETLVLMLVSQPLPALPSQLPKPEPQLIVQTPPPQLGLPFTAEQAAPQAPQ